jgi:hypothetical protein
MGTKESFGSAAYQEALAAAQEINKELHANDPRFNRAVLLIDEEGSIFFYRSAFVLARGKWILVFAEHHRAEAFHREELQVCKQYDVGAISGRPWDTASAEQFFMGWFAILKETPIETAAQPNSAPSKPQLYRIKVERQLLPLTDEQVQSLAEVLLRERFNLDNMPALRRVCESALSSPLEQITSKQELHALMQDVVRFANKNEKIVALFNALHLNAYGDDDELRQLVLQLEQQGWLSFES